MFPSKRAVFVAVLDGAALLMVARSAEEAGALCLVLDRRPSVILPAEWRGDDPEPAVPRILGRMDASPRVRAGYGIWPGSRSSLEIAKRCVGRDDKARHILADEAAQWEPDPWVADYVRDACERGGVVLLAELAGPQV